MKIIIYNPYALSNYHFSTGMEIALNHMNKGDTVHFVTCDGSLPSCESNPTHDPGICINCVLTKDASLDLIQVPMENRHGLNLHKFIARIENPVFSSIDELKDFKIEGVDFGAAVASSLITHLLEPKPDLTHHKHLIEIMLNMSLAVYNAIKHYINAIGPDTIYLYNGRFAPIRPALRAAQHLKTKALVHDRGGVLNRYLLVENTYVHDRKYLKKEIERLWNENDRLSEKENLARIWFEERKFGKDQSWISFTKAQDKDSLPADFDQSKRNVVIFNSSDDEFETIGGWENPFYGDQNEAVMEIVNSTKEQDIHFYLRVHPRLKDTNNSQTKAISALRSDNLTVVPADSKVDSYRLMASCEKTITFGSTMGIESAYWGKPSILAGRGLYEALGSCYVARDRDEISELIKGDIKALPNLGAIKYGYWQSARGRVFEHFVPEGIEFGRFLGKRVQADLSNKRSLVGALRKVKISSQNWRAAWSLERRSFPKRVLFINHNLPPHEYSGTPIITLKQAQGLKKRGLDVAVLIPSPDVKAEVVKQEQDGMIVYKVPCFGYGSAFFEDFSNLEDTVVHIGYAERVVLDFMPDIVHINDYVNMSARIIQHLSDAGCVVVREIWNDEEICFRISPIIQEDQNICPGPEKPSQCAECYFKKSFDVNAHSRICIDGKIYTHMKYVGHLYERKVDGVIFPCESFKEHFTRFIHIDEDKIEVIPHGIGFAQDQNFAERKKPDRPIFTFLGCIDFRKGVDILLKAFENIVDTDDFELRIYGNVANMGYVNQAKELELKYPGKIKYHGPYEPEDVPRIMEETDVGIVPSYFETYCCVLREFLVHGVPVICTDFFGSDIVQDGVNGLKIPVGKDRSLGQKMKSLLKNPKLITELKRGAKNTRIPTHEEEISDLLKFYEKLLKQEKQVDVQETLYDGLVGSPARNAAHFDQDPSYAKLKQLYVEKIQEAKAKDTYISRLQKVGRYDQKSIQAGLERIQKFDGALPVLKRVLDRMKRENVSSETLTEVGELCFCMGLSEHALYFFEKAIAVHQTNGRALNNLGVLAFQIEDFQTAREFFERALQISPNDQDAQDNLAALSNETNLMRRSADARTSSSSGAVLTIREGLKRVLGTVQSSGLGGDRVVQ